MSITNGNDARPDVLVDVPDFEQELLDHASGLRAMLDRESAEVERLKALLDDARKRQGRVQKAIDVLTGESSKPKPAAVAASKSSEWHISDVKLDQIWAEIREREGTFTRTEIAAELDGVSPESVRRAFERLRGGELIRITGKARGGGDNYAVMPNTRHVESAAEHGA